MSGSRNGDDKGKHKQQRQEGFSGLRRRRQPGHSEEGATPLDRFDSVDLADGSVSSSTPLLSAAAAAGSAPASTPELPLPHRRDAQRLESAPIEDSIDYGTSAFARYLDSDGVRNKFDLNLEKHKKKSRFFDDLPQSYAGINPLLTTFEEAISEIEEHLPIISHLMFEVEVDKRNSDTIRNKQHDIVANTAYDVWITFSFALALKSLFTLDGQIRPDILARLKIDKSNVNEELKIQLITAFNLGIIQDPIVPVLPQLQRNKVRVPVVGDLKNASGRPLELKFDTSDNRMGVTLTVANAHDQSEHRLLQIDNNKNKLYIDGKEISGDELKNWVLVDASEIPTHTTLENIAELKVKIIDHNHHYMDVDIFSAAKILRNRTDCLINIINQTAQSRIIPPAVTQKVIDDTYLKLLVIESEYELHQNNQIKERKKCKAPGLAREIAKFNMQSEAEQSSFDQALRDNKALKQKLNFDNPQLAATLITLQQAIIKVHRTLAITDDMEDSEFFATIAKRSLATRTLRLFNMFVNDPSNEALYEQLHFCLEKVTSTNYFGDDKPLLPISAEELEKIRAQLNKQFFANNCARLSNSKHKPEFISEKMQAYAKEQIKLDEADKTSFELARNQLSHVANACSTDANNPEHLLRNAAEDVLTEVRKLTDKNPDPATLAKLTRTLRLTKQMLDAHRTENLRRNISINDEVKPVESPELQALRSAYTQYATEVGGTFWGKTLKAAMFLLAGAALLAVGAVLGTLSFGVLFPVIGLSLTGAVAAGGFGMYCLYEGLNTFFSPSPLEKAVRQANQTALEVGKKEEDLILNKKLQELKREEEREKPIVDALRQAKLLPDGAPPPPPPPLALGDHPPAASSPAQAGLHSRSTSTASSRGRSSESSSAASSRSSSPSPNSKKTR